jgi:Saxitoxin biosynthesis operon protein SxtJ
MDVVAGPRLEKAPVIQETSMNIVSSPKLPSERSFGLLFMAVFAIVGVRGIFKHWSWIICIACFLASGACGLLALINPKVLAPFNKAWFYLGRGIGKVVSPIVLGIIFLGVLTPVSIVIWLFGRDELRLKRRPGSSYWIDRTSSTVTAHSFKNQF